MKKSLEDIKRDIKYTPFLTVILMVFITVLFFLQPEGAVERYGLALRAILAEPWRLVTNHFVHFDVSHFMMNALGLVFLGMLLENAGMKRKHILGGILLAIVFSDLFILFSQTIRPSLVAGFSGIVYGFIGMTRSIVGRKGVLGLAFLFFGVGALISGSNIAWSGHIGGFIGGLILAENV